MTLTRISSLATFATVGALLVPLQAASPPSRSSDLALSAAFAPPRYTVKNPEDRDRLRKYFQGLDRDSSQTFSLEGHQLKLSGRLAHRLAAEEDGSAVLVKHGERGMGEASSLRHRTRLRLQRALGTVGIEEDVPVFPAGYMPADADFIYTAPPEEEGKAACRDKSPWPLRNTGVMCGSVAGLDINIASVWERFDGADTLVIAVLDAGFDFLHPDLQGRGFVNEAEANGIAGVDDDGNGFIDDVSGWDFVDADNDPQDYQGHGTMISGIIAAGFDDGVGMPGVLPRVRILPVRVLSTASFGSAADIAEGIKYAAAMGAHVINFSIGIQGTATNQTLRNAFVVARDSGVIISAAAANDRTNLDTATTQPASYGFENVYVVASHTSSGDLAGHSNFGATAVDLAAPGADIVTTTIPPHLPLLQENFENFLPSRWSFGSGTYEVVIDTPPDTLQGAKSLKWISGNTATAVWNDTVNMRGKRGGLLRFRLNFQPATVRDVLFVDAQRKGSSAWVELGFTSSVVTDQTISINLGPIDDTLSRIRFQTCSFNNNRTSCTGSTAGRALRIDDIRITHADLTPGNHNKYIVTSGTSLAAPYVAAYAGLMRLATDRSGVPLTRALMLAGTKSEPALAGKVATGGRLDVAKGLQFYLNTLPRIAVADSLETAWVPGAAVAYALTVRDAAGPRNDFTFSPISLPPGGTLSSDGVFAWNTGGATNGTFAVRAKAENGTHVLRSLTTFTVGTASPILAATHQASRLRVGGRLFLLPAAAFDGTGRPLLLRVEIYGADGKTLRRLEGALSLPAGARVVDYQLTGIQGVGARAWLNGVALRPARD